MTYDSVVTSRRYITNYK